MEFMPAPRSQLFASNLLKILKDLNFASILRLPLSPPFFSVRSKSMTLYGHGDVELGGFFFLNLGIICPAGLPKTSKGD